MLSAKLWMGGGIGTRPILRLQISNIVRSVSIAGGDEMKGMEIEGGRSDHG